MMMNSRIARSPNAHPLGRSWPGLRLSLEHMEVGEKSRFWIPRGLIDYSKPTEVPEYYLFELELLDIRPLNTRISLTPQQLDVVRQFNLLYAKTHTQARNINWMGVEIQQNPCDAWMWQEIIWELKPDFIVETGTYTGGSALYFASLLELMDLPGKVVSVDINPMLEQVSTKPVFRRRVQVIRGDSVAPEVVEQVTESVKDGKVVLVTLDSLHTKDHVLKELERYGPLVTPGSYLVVQDTRIQDFAAPRREPGPGEAVEEFLKTHPEFEVDRDRERLLLTFYSGGYLRRVR
jgi:cephalosporin hydroxylase